MKSMKNMMVAYDMQSRNKKKKMAKGGEINDSAKTMKRPMPEEMDKDEHDIKDNDSKKPLVNSQATDNSTIKQAQKPSITRLSQPKMVLSDAFSVRNRSMRDDENDFGDKIYPESDKAQPTKRDDEKGPDRQGPQVPDRQHQHKARMAAYQQASENQYAQDMAADNMKKTQSPLGRYADGGEVDGAKTSTGGAKTGGAKTSTTGNKTKTGGSNPGGASTGGAGTVTITTRDLGSKGINVSNVGGKTDAKNHGGMDPGDEDDDGKTMMARGGSVMEPKDNHDELEERTDEGDMGDELEPGYHGEHPAMWRDELDADMENPAKLDMEDEHSNGRKPYFKGGQIDDMDQPEEEHEEERHNSIVAAVMSKMHRALKMVSGSHDEDEAEMFAEGGMAGVSTNNKEQPNAYYKANKASLKENYTEELDEPMDSNEHGDDLHDEDAHDMVSKIRSQMNVRRQFKGK